MSLRLLFLSLLTTVLSGQSGAAESPAHLWPPPEGAVSWSAPGHHSAGSIHLRLLGFNDFHGNLQIPVTPSARPVGGAAALAGYLKQAARSMPARTLILHAGDLLGASPPATRLLHNEPGIEFLNLLANQYCHGEATRAVEAGDWHSHPNRCNVVGTLGNHEFDAGIGEILRLLDGGNSADGPFLENPYPGSRAPYVCSNVRIRSTGRLLLPAYTVVTLAGIPVGVIGAVLRDTPSIIPPWAAHDLEFLDEAQSINHAAAELEAQGIHTLIVIIHQGLTPHVTDRGIEYQGPLQELVAQLDPDIDVVVSGHTHSLTNTLLPSSSGTPVLVTQAYSYGEAFDQIELQIDPRTRDVVAKSARIVPAWADVAPGTPGDAQALALSERAQQMVASRVSQAVGTLRQPMTRVDSDAGESALGDLVADAQRAAMHADVALMNPGGLRTDLNGKIVTYGDILTVHPFGNHLVALDLSGEQLLAVLEQQWRREGGMAASKILKTSGLRYSWDATQAAGKHVRAACDGSGAPIDSKRHYRVVVSDFLAAGGDDFAGLTAAGPGELGPLDADALSDYLREHSPATIPDGPRISRIDIAGPQVCGQDGADRSRFAQP